ncbi:MAG: ArsR family transcriptional regulator [Candidatus Saliniplasma sp.]
MNEPVTETRIFSTQKGAVVIESKTKNKIIQLLMEGDKTSREISDALDKAKSTTSVHLSDLENLGLIETKVDKEDKRLKIFSLNTKLLGTSDIPTDEHYLGILENLKKSSGDEYNFLKSLFHLIRYGLSSFGLDVHPALREIGRDAGRKMAENLEVGSMDELLKEVRKLWFENQLGDVEIVDSSTIVVHDCFDCCDMPDVGTTFCSLDEGMIEGIVDEALGISVSVREIECFGKGDENCKFEIIEDQ